MNKFNLIHMPLYALFTWKVIIIKALQMFLLLSQLTFVNKFHLT